MFCGILQREAPCRVLEDHFIDREKTVKSQTFDVRLNITCIQTFDIFIHVTHMPQCQFIIHLLSVSTLYKRVQWFLSSQSHVTMTCLIVTLLRKHPNKPIFISSPSLFFYLPNYTKPQICFLSTCRLVSSCCFM